MTNPVHDPPWLIYPVGTKVVAAEDVFGPNGRVVHPKGSVGVVVRAPKDLEHSYRVKFPDGVEGTLRREQLTMLAKFKEGALGVSDDAGDASELYQRVIFRCVIGSQAYGLSHEDSDVDRRGVYLPSADRHWSLYGVPEQIENHENQEAYWEVEKFLTLALRANPNVLECLYTPMVEFATPLARELLEMRSAFLSRLVYQTYNGYVMSQFKKMEADLRNHGAVKWKHVMHLIRLLLSGIRILKDGFVPIRVDEHRDVLLAVRRGETPWEEIDDWRKRLHVEFDAAAKTTTLPDRPDYDRANRFLLKARRLALAEELP
jgi:predicted nucleotidyltransferase